MAFNDWQDTANVEPLALPIRDRDGQPREYVIPPLGYLDAIKLRAETARIRDEGPAAGTMSNEEFLKLILGGQLKQMREDNVPPAAIVHAASVAHADAFAGRAAAERLWNEGPDPEALAAAMKAANSASSTTSPSTAAAGSSTKKPASTRGTKPPTKKAPKSAGTRSSTAPS